MVITTNTIKKEPGELSYNELLLKLNSKELLEQGVKFLLDNKKAAAEQYTDKRPLKKFYASKTTVLVYNHTNNEFRFINVSSYGEATTIKTSIGRIIATPGYSYRCLVGNRLLKALSFPQNTLVVKVNDNSNVIIRLDLVVKVNDNSNVIIRLEEDSEYAKTMIKNTINRAKQLLEEQFIKAPLGGGLESAFIKEQTDWVWYNRAVLISLFPQFKSQAFKKLEKDRLLGF